MPSGVGQPRRTIAVGKKVHFMNLSGKDTCSCGERIAQVVKDILQAAQLDYDAPTGDQVHLHDVLLFCRTSALGNMRTIDHTSSSLIHEALLSSFNKP